MRRAGVQILTSRYPELPSTFVSLAVGRSTLPEQNAAHLDRREVVYERQ
jgi:hypothetical protein